MKRLLALTASALGLLALASPAGASSDYSCEPKWRMPGRAGCAETAMLAPANDTRVNLLLLARDRQGQGMAGLALPRQEYEYFPYGRTFFSWSLLKWTLFGEAANASEPDGAGSRCQTVQASAPAFVQAVAANRRVPTAERELLEKARGQLGCGKAEAQTWPAGIVSSAGKDFAGYLTAADAFYRGEWQGARAGFVRLTRSQDPWLAETASYMRARNEINAAQATAFNEYGDFDGSEKVDKGALGLAQTALADYLKRYSNGRYAASARGLVRRALWLGGDMVGLAREYERLLIATPGAQLDAARLVQEIDYKLLLKDDAAARIDAPLLLATIDLMLMRPQDELGKPGLTEAQLASQQARFASRPELYSYLLASHAFHVAGDPRRVLTLISDDARQSSYAPLAFSRQVLRGMALAALGDRNEAGFWRELLRGADTVFQRPIIELAIALQHERSGRLAKMFAAGSPVQDGAIRAVVLAHTASPALLRAQAGDRSRSRRERDVALFTLLSKELNRGLYAEFLRDRALVPTDGATEVGFWSFPLQEKIPVGLFAKGSTSGEDYPCPALAATAATLARNPRDAKGLLCLGEFYRLNGFDGLAEAYRPRERGELGSGPEQFPGKPLYRDAIYARVMADTAAAPNERAYALYRALRCYAPTGNNSCSGESVDVSVRRGWFQRLKREFSATPWASKLEVFW
jgi:hypothetical protein